MNFDSFKEPGKRRLQFKSEKSENVQIMISLGRTETRGISENVQSDLTTETRGISIKELLKAYHRKMLFETVAFDAGEARDEYERHKHITNGDEQRQRRHMERHHHRHHERMAL